MFKVQNVGAELLKAAEHRSVVTSASDSSDCLTAALNLLLKQEKLKLILILLL